MPEFTPPPKTSWVDKFRGKPEKKLFTKSGVDKWCPHCKRVFAGPDEGMIHEPLRDSSRAIGPMVFNRHKVSIETCPNCREHGVEDKFTTV